MMTETQFSLRNVVYLNYTLDNGKYLTIHLYDLMSFIYILSLVFSFVYISFPFFFVLDVKVRTCQIRQTSNAICQERE